MSCKVFAVTAALAAVVGSHAGERPEAGRSDAQKATGVPDSGADEAATQRTLERRPDHLDLGEPTVPEFNRWLAALPKPVTARKCGERAERDSRAGFLVPVRGAGRLLVGKPDDGAEAGTTRIRDVERNYYVVSFTRSGAPLEGTIKIKMAHDEMQVERVCLERLLGAAVAWPTLTDDPSDVEETVEMVVLEVSFAAAGEIGPTGQAVATGETVATLALSERWVSMAMRELKAHRWGVVGGMVGSIVLMIATWLGGRAVRQLRTYSRLVGVGRKTPMESAEGRGEGHEEDDGRMDESQEEKGRGEATRAGKSARRRSV